MAPRFFTYKANLQVPKKGLKLLLNYWKVETNLESQRDLFKLVQDNCGNSKTIVKGYFCRKDNEIFLLPGVKLDESFVKDRSFSGLRANINSIKLGGENNLSFINSLTEVPKDDITKLAITNLIEDSSSFFAVMTASDIDGNVKLETTSDYEDCVDQLDCMENLTLNTLFGKDKEKVEISVFDPKDVSSSEWVSNAVFAFELAGIKDENKMVAKLLTRLPSDLLTRVRESLKNEVNEDTDKVTIKNFEQTLNLLTKKTDAELSSDLEKLKFESKMTMRDLWHRIENLYRWKMPEIDNLSRNKMVVQSFRAKVPNEIRRNLLFLNSEIDDIKLADQAQRLYDNSHINFEANHFRVNQKGKNPRGFENRNKNVSYSRNQKVKFSGFCHKCGKKGHRAVECWHNQGNSSNQNRQRNFQSGQGGPRRDTIVCNYCRINGHKSNRCFKRLQDLLDQGRREQRPSGYGN